MAKYCTNCGVDLNESFKFCPECGAEITVENDKTSIGENSKKVEGIVENSISDLIICDNCGEENYPAEKICTGCGIVLKGELTKKTIPAEKTAAQRISEKKEFKSHKQKKKPGKKKIKPDSKRELKSKSKEIDPKKIYLIASVIIIFVIVILFASGVFDPGVTGNQNFNSGNNQTGSSGIDLNSLQRINDLEARVNANPDDMELLLDLAHLKNDGGFYDQAIPLYQKYLEKIPGNADARIDMGVCYYNIGNYDTAISEMKKALEYQPKHQIGHLNLGVVNLTAGNVDEAKSWFQKAIELGPDTDVGKRAKELLKSHNL